MPVFNVIVGFFPSIGGCDAPLKGAHRYGPIGGNERQKRERLTIFLLLFICKWHTLFFSAGSAGSWNMSRRGVPKIRKINDANFLLDIGMKSFYSGSKASDVCPEV